MAQEPDAVRGVVQPPVPAVPGHLTTTKYHALKATEKWSEFDQAMQDLATHTVAERERVAKDRTERTTYGRAEQNQQGGT